MYGDFELSSFMGITLNDFSVCDGRNKHHYIVRVPLCLLKGFSDSFERCESRQGLMT